MGDDSYGFTNVHYAVMNDDGEYGELHELGEAVSFDIDMPDDEAERYADAIVGLQTGMSFEIKLEWWMYNAWYRIFGAKTPYTIRRLRRGGKSHRRR